MALSDKFEVLLASHKVNSPFCAYGQLYASLNDKDKKALDEAWAKGYSANLVVNALRADGHKTSAEAIRKHRTGNCHCPK